MIVGYFLESGHPFINCRVIIPRIGLEIRLWMLVDTGADNTSLHLNAAVAAAFPFELFTVMRRSHGVGGSSMYFVEPALIRFEDGDSLREYVVELRIAEPSADTAELPSILGRNVINHWQMNYDPTNATLQFTVRHADRTFRRNV